MTTHPEDAMARERAQAGRFRKRPVEVEATQWFKNGDHPDDYSEVHHGFENGELREFPAAERKGKQWEGDVVRYYRHPDDSGERKCQHCGIRMHEHGWIDTLEGGHNVCPGDWIITGTKGERYPCKPDIFAEIYEPALASAQQEPAPSAEVEEIAKKLEALGSTLSSRAKQYAGCSWLPDPSRPVADSMPGIWEYRQAALCAEAAAAIRRYAGDGGVTDEMVEAACKAYESVTEEMRGIDPKDMRSALEASARAKSGEKGGAR